MPSVVYVVSVVTLHVANHLSLGRPPVSSSVFRTRLASSSSARAWSMRSAFWLRPKRSLICVRVKPPGLALNACIIRSATASPVSITEDVAGRIFGVVPNRQGGHEMLFFYGPRQVHDSVDGRQAHDLSFCATHHCSEEARLARRERAIDLLPHPLRAPPPS